MADKGQGGSGRGGGGGTLRFGDRTYIQTGETHNFSSVSGGETTNVPQWDFVLPNGQRARVRDLEMMLRLNRGLDPRG